MTTLKKIQMTVWRTFMPISLVLGFMQIEGFVLERKASRAQIKMIWIGQPADNCQNLASMAT